LRRDATCRLGVVRFVGLEKDGPPRGVGAAERPPVFRREQGLADLGLVVGVARRSLAATAGRSSDRSAQDHHRADKGREVGARTESIHAAADLTFAADPSSYSQTTSPADGSTAPMAKERSEPHHGLDHRLLLRKHLQRPWRSLRDLRQQTRTQRFKRRGRRQLPPARRPARRRCRCRAHPCARARHRCRIDRKPAVAVAGNLVALASALWLCELRSPRQRTQQSTTSGIPHNPEVQMMD
jgi:hypothetical protein